MMIPEKAKIRNPNLPELEDHARDLPNDPPIDLPNDLEEEHEQLRDLEEDDFLIPNVWINKTIP